MVYCQYSSYDRAELQLCVSEELISLVWVAGRASASLAHALLQGSFALGHDVTGYDCRDGIAKQAQQLALQAEEDAACALFSDVAEDEVDEDGKSKQEQIASFIEGVRMGDVELDLAVVLATVLNLRIHMVSRQKLCSGIALQVRSYEGEALCVASSILVQCKLSCVACLGLICAWLFWSIGCQCSMHMYMAAMFSAWNVLHLIMCMSWLACRCWGQC